jgi:hypothetical protein
MKKKKLPTGVSDFKKIMQGNYYYPSFDASNCQRPDTKKNPLNPMDDKILHHGDILKVLNER